MEPKPAPGSRVPGVLESLRTATRSHHVTLAASPAMLRLFDDAYTVVEYRAHLGRLLGLFEPLERVAALAAGPAAAGRFPRTSSALRGDLRNMGSSAQEIEALERCRRLPPIARAGLAGYTYVTLGSRLGGKIIAERLRATLGSEGSFGFYGDGSGLSEARWVTFCADLEESGKNDVEAICATAAGIFDAYGAWLAQPPRGASGA